MLMVLIPFHQFFLIYFQLENLPILLFYRLVLVREFPLQFLESVLGSGNYILHPILIVDRVVMRAHTTVELRAKRQRD